MHTNYYKIVNQLKLFKITYRYMKLPVLWLQTRYR